MAKKFGIQFCAPFFDFVIYAKFLYRKLYNGRFLIFYCTWPTIGLFCRTAGMCNTRGYKRRPFFYWYNKYRIKYIPNFFAVREIKA